MRQCLDLKKLPGGKWKCEAKVCAVVRGACVECNDHTDVRPSPLLQHPAMAPSNKVPSELSKCQRVGAEMGGREMT